MFGDRQCLFISSVSYIRLDIERLFRFLIYVSCLLLPSISAISITGGALDRLLFTEFRFLGLGMDALVIVSLFGLFMLSCAVGEASRSFSKMALATRL